MFPACFVNHCITEHGWGSFDCHYSNCKFQAYSTFCLKKHLLAHVTENRGKNLIVTCPRQKCGMKFRYNSHLQHHLNVHDNNLIKCSFCPWAGAKFENYLLHTNTHFKIKPYKCSKCDACFYRPWQLEGHFEMRHEIDLQKYSCEHCQFQTHADAKLYYHLATKHSEIKTSKIN